MSLSGTSELPWFTRPSGVDRSGVKISSAFSYTTFSLIDANLIVSFILLVSTAAASFTSFLKAEFVRSYSKLMYLDFILMDRENSGSFY